jgi:hypothetical protein
MAALSIYLVMQTLEAVIFRLLILSIPLHLTWFIGRESRGQHLPLNPLSLEHTPL